MGIDAPDSPIMMLLDRLSGDFGESQRQLDEAGFRWSLFSHVHGVLQWLGNEGAEDRIVPAACQQLQTAESSEKKLRLMRLLLSDARSPFPFTNDNPRRPLTDMQRLALDSLEPVKEQLVEELCALLDPRPKKKRKKKK